MNQPTTGDTIWTDLGEVLTTHDLMRITGMKEVTIWRWLKRGTLPGHVIGGSWIVYGEEVRKKMTDDSEQPREPSAFLATFSDVLKIKDAEVLFGKTRQTVYKWLSQGAIPGHQMGSSWVMYRHELRDVLVATSNQVPRPDLEPDVQVIERRIRRLDRSRPSVITDIGLHENVAQDFRQTARQQGVSPGVYLEQLLTLSRNESGHLPILFSTRESEPWLPSHELNRGNGLRSPRRRQNP